MRNFNSRDGIFKPIPGIKITPEGIPIQNEGHKNVQSRTKAKPQVSNGRSIVAAMPASLQKMREILFYLSIVPILEEMKRALL